MDEFLPPKPEKPREEDCCGSGCASCVFDIYNKQLIEWEKTCNEVKQQKKRHIDGTRSVLLPFRYKPFQITSIICHTFDTNIYRFQAVDVKSSKITNVTSNLNIQLGQHLIMKVNTHDGTILTRAYTPISCSAAHAEGYFDTLIKLYPNGQMSNYIKNFKKGDIVYWKGPFGNFQYVKNTYKHVFFICGGTGIAPMIRIIRSIVEDEDEETVIRLLYSCKKYCEVLLSDEIYGLTSYWNFSQRIFITRETPQKIKYGEDVVSGKITQEAINDEITNKQLNHVLILVCGTRLFNKDIMNFALKASVARDNILLF